MKLFERKRAFIRVISFSIAAMFVLGGFCYAGWNQAASLEYQIENDRQQAFSELVSALNAIDTALQKGVYSRSPVMQSTLANEVARQASSAASALGRLPYSFVELENTSKFISEVGDFSSAMAKKLAIGESYTTDEVNSFTSLSKIAKELSTKLTDLQESVSLYNMKFGNMNVSGVRQSIDRTAVPVIADGYKDIEGEFPKIPALVYDGPFSSHVENKTPMLLNGQKEASPEIARNRAADLIGLSSDKVVLTGESSGKLPTYQFEYDNGDSSSFIEITKTGGIPLTLLSSRNVETAKLAPEQCISNARSFLEEHGFKNMRDTYWIISNNSVMINFAYEQDGVICYPDLIKVAVAQDDGKITGLESRGYVMNHQKRVFSPAKITEEHARELIASSLKVDSHYMAVVPTGGQNEVFCHVFRCRGQENRGVLVFLDAATGNEEKILLLLESEKGTLSL